MGSKGIILITKRGLHKLGMVMNSNYSYCTLVVLKGEDVRIETIVLNRVDNEGTDSFADYKRIYKDPGRVSNSKNPTEHPIETLPGGVSSVWKNSCPLRYRRDGLEGYSDPSSEGRSRR